MRPVVLQSRVRQAAKLGMQLANKGMDATVGGVGRLIIHGEVRARGLIAAAVASCISFVMQPPQTRTSHPELTPATAVDTAALPAGSPAQDAVLPARNPI